MIIASALFEWKQWQNKRLLRSLMGLILPLGFFAYAFFFNPLYLSFVFFLLLLVIAWIAGRNCGWGTNEFHELMSISANMGTIVAGKALAMSLIFVILSIAALPAFIASSIVWVLPFWQFPLCLYVIFNSYLLSYSLCLFLSVMIPKLDGYLSGVFACIFLVATPFFGPLDIFSPITQLYLATRASLDLSVVLSPLVPLSISLLLFALSARALARAKERSHG